MNGVDAAVGSRDASVVDQRVDSAVGLDHLGERCDHGIFVACIGPNRKRHGTVVNESLGGGRVAGERDGNGVTRVRGCARCFF